MTESGLDGITPSIFGFECTAGALVTVRRPFTSKDFLHEAP